MSWLRLIRSHRVGPATFYRLLDEHGSAGAALAALPGVARAAGVTGYTPCPIQLAEAELEAAQACGAFALRPGDGIYPDALAAIADAPPLIWARGDAGVLAAPMVAMVGARNASALGQRMARALAEGLGRDGLVVVSGLARGIDTAAHTAALPTGTVAVCAGGVDVIYPAENAPLAARIQEAGLLISEQPMGLVPQARHFPRRNRLISGLSLGVVVIEAAQRSGSLITVSDALEQGREVMAVPGHPFDARAEGCNALIRDGATLVRDAADVRAVLGRAAAGANARPTPERPAPRTLSTAGPDPRAGAAPSAAHRAAAMARDPAPTSAAMPDGANGDAAADPRALSHRILDRLGPSPLQEDQLIRDLGLPVAEVMPGLLELELDGRILRAPGGLLSRVP
ncbi:DNA protecting protein DprA [Rhodobaculum claviforme]|uniref:DNA protecting protein DprA n=1 Tax=Rhodobaculum claviforme TaxID=1549854 RepID=A0A934WHK8_9RHOB|nr:DNA protecting protein DprA [Rhodobaculum claviforme]